MLSKINKKQEWKIVRAVNIHECNNTKNKSVKEKYLEWIKAKNKLKKKH